MKTFSQRKGFKPISETIQIESISPELRISLWNVLDIALWSRGGYLYGRPYSEAPIGSFARILWLYYFKKPIDAMPNQSDEILAIIRAYFFDCEWFEVYDFLEFVVVYHQDKKSELSDLLNQFLERELSAYRFVADRVTDITGEQEIEMLEEALADSRFAGVTAHLRKAFELYADRENPDYRNSIKESISAVEATARIVADDPKATLGDALKKLERKARLHPALKQGFLNIYGYASDAQGIRHAMSDVPTLTQADARYFLLSCTSFVNYLKSFLP